jgi:hypothetical protein
MIYHRVTGFLRGRMIWLLAHPSPSLPTVPRQATNRKTEKERQLSDGRGVKGVGVEPNHTHIRKPGPHTSSILFGRDLKPGIPPFYNVMEDWDYFSVHVRII